MSKKKPTEDELQEMRDRSYMNGSRMAWLTILTEAMGHLGYSSDEAKRVAWVTEREQAVQMLRGLCEEFGDNEWDEDLHLADVIDKHLGSHLKR